MARPRSSPNVVQTLDLGRADDGALYIVMELIVGVTLSTLVRTEAKRKRIIPVGVALEILAQSAQGLDDAHDAMTPTGYRLDIVHRDVSPQNILVGADGRVRVTDFGIARAVLRRTETNSGQLKGKFPYFSPEQAAGAKLDRRSDVFALGIVAWEALTGRGLFHSESPLVSLDRVKNLLIPAPHRFRSEIAPEVSEVIMKALERDADARFQSASDFGVELRRVAREFATAPNPREIGRYVAEVGGEALTRIQERIDHGLAGADAQTNGRGEVAVQPAEPVSTPAPAGLSGVRVMTPTGAVAEDPGAAAGIPAGDPMAASLAEATAIGTPISSPGMGSGVSRSSPGSAPSVPRPSLGTAASGMSRSSPGIATGSSPGAPGSGSIAAIASMPPDHAVTRGRAVAIGITIALCAALAASVIALVIALAGGSGAPSHPPHVLPPPPPRVASPPAQPAGTGLTQGTAPTPQPEATQPATDQGGLTGAAAERRVGRHRRRDREDEGTASGSATTGSGPSSPPETTSRHTSDSASTRPRTGGVVGVDAFDRQLQRRRQP